MHFLVMETCDFQIKIDWNMFQYVPWGIIDDKSALVKVMVFAEQTVFSN